MDGRRLLPLVRAEQPPQPPWRQTMLAEFHGHHFPYPQRMLRTRTHKLVVNPESCNELYDLVLDPAELVNRIGDPGYAGVRRELVAELYRQLRDRGADVLLSRGAPADGRADPSQRGRLAGAAPRRGNPNISTLWGRAGRAHRQDYVGGYVSFVARSRVTMYGPAYPDLAATGFRTRYQRFATTCPRHRTALSAVSVKWPNCSSW